ncbi:type II toxin-antitoxin system RelE/ParE family toxin [Mucisphaera calidilacus]|uniref:Plasmid stabilization system protein n=1 Tax=Mucisphaera calidilacus TaxID=2527982 RepID=A0A518BXZ1_9BACT|nr:type II toxin-antitoxin system RelE/ParE family toxin [Mucisphaera calidilacus]QDU71841.1 Plasmid stabilization system protein [Mucisphaera calidilacus]
MNWRVEVTSQARADIKAVLRYTLDRFGPNQVRYYRVAIDDSLKHLETDPVSVPAKPLTPPLPSIRQLPVRLRGRSGRHALIYRLDEVARVVIVLRLLHRAMDLGRHVEGEAGEDD